MFRIRGLAHRLPVRTADPLEVLGQTGPRTLVVALVEGFEKVSVPGQSSWPQNLPFDRNLALIFACNTCLVENSTTNKTPQSTDRFAR